MVERPRLSSVDELAGPEYEGPGGSRAEVGWPPEGHAVPDVHEGGNTGRPRKGAQALDRWIICLGSRATTSKYNQGHPTQEDKTYLVLGGPAGSPATSTSLYGPACPTGRQNRDVRGAPDLPGCRAGPWRIARNTRLWTSSTRRRRTFTDAAQNGRARPEALLFPFFFDSAFSVFFLKVRLRGSRGR